MSNCTYFLSVFYRITVLTVPPEPEQQMMEVHFRHKGPLTEADILLVHTGKSTEHYLGVGTYSVGYIVISVGCTLSCVGWYLKTQNISVIVFSAVRERWGRPLSLTLRL